MESDLPGRARSRTGSRTGTAPGRYAERVFPAPGTELTHILVVRDPERSRTWYEDVLGATVERAYGSSVVLRFAGSWLLLVEGGEPTPDKPTVTLAAPDDPDRLDHLFTIRVEDCQATYELLRSRGAGFLTPPVVNGSETRCFLRDPDGHLFELSEYRPAS
jgi:catechol 2,3-dioxygenase-like lactoylglutathione lyase family enzyme